jgi:hypothetical protein
VGKRRGTIALPTVQRTGVGSVDARHVRASWTLPSFAFLASLTFVLAAVIDPTAAFAMSREAVQVSAPGGPGGPIQTVTAGDTALTIVRGQYGVTKYTVAVPKVGKPDPGTAKAIAYDMVLARGWDEAQYSCLVSLWERESHWNVNAHNARSGAHGIPQALPGSKMASVAADWETNPTTQITWGLGYIAGRYVDPCGAWTSSEQRGWY